MLAGLTVSLGKTPRLVEQGFMSIVGSILYASAMTRPDISFHTAFLAKLMSTPSPAALDAALGIVSTSSVLGSWESLMALMRTSSSTRIAPGEMRTPAQWLAMHRATGVQRLAGRRSR